MEAKLSSDERSVARTAQSPATRGLTPEYNTRGNMRVQTKQQTIADREQTRAQLNLLLSGFRAQQRVRAEQVAAAVDIVPMFHLAGLDQIIYDPNWDTRSGFALRQTHCPKRSKGVFLRAERKILVFGFADLDELEHILYHEIGHHVFDRILSARLRKKWVTAINPRSRYITRYAARTAAEDFAESYAVFVRDPKALARIPRKYSFMRDDVFAGIALNIQKGHIDVSV